VVSGSQPVTARLDMEVAAHRLQRDGAQFAAARRLDALRAALRAQDHGIAGWLRGAAARLAGRPRRALRGLYLWGGVGRGKTLLMDFFFASPGMRAERSHFYHFMRDVHAELAAARGRADPLEIVAQGIAARTRVVCLDEFFVADIADAMILAGLFDGLFRRGVVLVATSNTRPDELYKDGLQRQRFLPAIELLRANLDVLHLDGAIDYRLRELEQAPTYLDSNAADAPLLLRRRFLALSGGGASGPVTLAIEGRPLPAVDSSGGMVWFEFVQLCDGPRSQNDYIELARLYHTVFISDIPIFGAFDEDAARRFVMLIDEFYDRAVKMVVSAAAPPAELYRGERLSFEFQRAASRLAEMQSQPYLARPHRP